MPKIIVTDSRFDLQTGDRDLERSQSLSQLLELIVRLRKGDRGNPLGGRLYHNPLARDGVPISREWIFL
jgi:tryptophan synthase alpha subunit